MTAPTIRRLGYVSYARSMPANKRNCKQYVARLIVFVRCFFSINVFVSGITSCQLARWRHLQWSVERGLLRQTLLVYVMIVCSMKQTLSCYSSCLIKSPLQGVLRNGDVHLSVRLSVCLFVCRLGSQQGCPMCLLPMKKSPPWNLLLQQRLSYYSRRPWTRHTYLFVF